MRSSTVALSIARIATLTIWFLLCFILPGLFIPTSRELQDAMQKSGQGVATLVYLLGFSCLVAMVSSYAIRHASIGGSKLMGGLAVTMFGFMTAMGQIETYYFRGAFPLLPPEEILKIVFRGLITAVVYVPLAAAMWRRNRSEDGAKALHIVQKSWAWKVPILAVIYVVFYFGFGYYVAWQFPETRQLYTGSTEILGLWEHLGNIVTESPSFLPLQFIRGVLWIVFALPLMFLLGGRRRETIFGLGLLGGLFGLEVLLPSPFFPEMVRYAHALETVPSTAAYCALIGVFLIPRGGAK